MKKPKKSKNELPEITVGRTNPAKKKFEKNLKHGKTKKRLALKISLGVLFVGVTAFVLYNQIADKVYNSGPQTSDPFTNGNIWDGNGNDLEFDNNGNIITDKMTDADKQILSNQIKGLVQQDASSRCDSEIKEIKDILSISLLPYNLNENDNEFDKYLLSILFADSTDTYALNYFTGTDFVSEEENVKDFSVDFVNFINHDCALDNCSKMSENATLVKDKLGQDVLHVGEAYKGYRENGDEYYFIPTYHQDGTATVYSAWSSFIDAYDLDPTERLLEQISDENSEKIFQSTDYTPSENLKKVMQILEEIKTPDSAETQTEKTSIVVPKKYDDFTK